MTHLARLVRLPLAAARRVVCTGPRASAVEAGQRCCLEAATEHCHGDDEHAGGSASKAPMLLGASFAFLGFFEEEKEKELPVVTMIKRSILLIQRGDFKKAEQMLHIALREAQNTENEDAITYVYDVMANLAFEAEEFDKAQKLFKAVMQRELAKGTAQDDLKIVHMSLKMAKILESQKDYLNAERGYQFCLEILQDLMDKGTEDIATSTLWAMTLDWYAHLLLAISKYNEAMKLMEKAYIMCVKLNGEVHEQSVVLLNDLGSISFINGNFDDAIEYLSKAVEIGQNLPDMEDIGAIHVNLGNVYIKKGLLDEAKRSCTRGWKLSKRKEHNESLEEAKACLDEVNKLLTK